MDRYSPLLLPPLVLILGLNVLDILFTLTILDAGGTEVNPVVGSAIELWGDGFWVWKFILSSVCVILLCLHSRHRLVKEVIFGITTMYVTLVLYQLSLVIQL